LIWLQKIDLHNYFVKQNSHYDNINNYVDIFYNQVWLGLTHE